MKVDVSAALGVRHREGPGDADEADQWKPGDPRAIGARGPPQLGRHRLARAARVDRRRAASEVEHVAGAFEKRTERAVPLEHPVHVFGRCCLTDQIAMDLGAVERIVEEVGIRHRARDRAPQGGVRAIRLRAFDSDADQWNAPGPRTTALLSARSSPSTKCDVSNSRARSRAVSASPCPRERLEGEQTTPARSSNSRLHAVDDGLHPPPRRARARVCRPPSPPRAMPSPLRPAAECGARRHYRSTSASDTAPRMRP